MISGPSFDGIEAFRQVCWPNLRSPLQMKVDDLPVAGSGKPSSKEVNMGSDS